MLISVNIIRFDDEDQTDVDIEVRVEVDYNSDDGVTSCEYRGICEWDDELAYSLTKTERARIFEMQEDDRGRGLDQMAWEESEESRADAQIADIEDARGY